MKKIIALALAFTLSISLMAGLVIDSEACSLTSGLGVGYSICILEPNGAADVLDAAEIASFGSRVLGTDVVTIDLPILSADFLLYVAASNSYEPGLVTDNMITNEVNNHLEVKFTDEAETGVIFRERAFVPYENGRQAIIRLTAENIGTCKGFIYLVFTHDDGTKTESQYYPVNGQFIDPTINKSITALTGRNLVENTVELDNKRITGTKDQRLNAVNTLGIIAPESELRFKLDTEFFLWDPLINNMNTTVRKSTMDNFRIEVKTKFLRGSKLVDTVEIENIDGAAWVVVTFAEILASTEEKDFDFTIWLTYRDKIHEDTAVQIAGTLANGEIYCEDLDYVYIGDGTIARTDEIVKNIELDMGNGVSVFRNLMKDKKYFGIARDEVLDVDLEIMEYYPSIRRVLNLTTRNVSTSGNVVKITLTNDETDNEDRLPSNDGSAYYVYDENGKYLGTTDNMLPFRDKYYLSTGIITLDAAVAEDVLEAEEELNDTDNPDTGAANGMNYFVLLGCTFIALGAVTAFRARRFA